MAEIGRVKGDFRLMRSLGRGGLGEVFLGQAPDGRQVAVKVLQSNRQGDSRTRAHSAQQYYDLPKTWSMLDSGIRMIHEDLRRAEQICARTERP